MAGWAQTSQVNGVNRSSLFSLSSIKCLCPPQGKWSQAFEVCHLPANGAALMCAHSPGPVWLLNFVKDKLI